MINQLQNLDAWLSHYFPFVALERLLNPAIFSLIFFCAVIGLGSNQLNFNWRDYQPQTSTEFVLLFGVGVVLAFLINFSF